jgi:hypothetical protein
VSNNIPSIVYQTTEFWEHCPKKGRNRQTVNQKKLPQNLEKKAPKTMKISNGKKQN